MKKLLFISMLFAFSCGMLYAHEADNPDGEEVQVTINGLLYELSKATHTAMVANQNTWDGELVIPEQVNYDNEAYTVNGIEWLAFDGCKTLTKVTFPKTLVTIRHYCQYEDCKNPFTGCSNLESIEVEEGNPSMCSVDGVLFNKDMTKLFCYPMGARGETYIIPEGVTWIGGDAFAGNPYLVNVVMPNSVTHLSFRIFSGCKSLSSIKLSESVRYIGASSFEKCESLHFLDIPESVTSFGESVFRWSPKMVLIVRGTFPEELRDDTFYFMDDATVIYVQPSEIEKFKKVFNGTVLPLEEYTNDIKQIMSIQSSGPIYTLQGQRVESVPRKGVYIQNGKKVVIKIN